MADEVQRYIEEAEQALLNAERAAQAEGCAVCQQLIQPLNRQVHNLSEIRVLLNDYLSTASENGQQLSGILSTSPNRPQQAAAQPSRRMGFGLMDMWQDRPRLQDFISGRRQ